MHQPLRDEVAHQILNATLSSATGWTSFFPRMLLCLSAYTPSCLAPTVLSLFGLNTSCVEPCLSRDSTNCLRFACSLTSKAARLKACLPHQDQLCLVILPLWLRGVHSWGGRSLPVRPGAVGRLPAVYSARHMRPHTDAASYGPHLQARLRTRYGPRCARKARTVRLPSLHRRPQL